MDASRQDDFLTKGRRSQKQRTRDALIDAATTLARSGHQLAITEVAEAAGVSNATAYRYFPNPQSLWAEVAVQQGVSAGLLRFLEDLPDDPGARLDTVIRNVATYQFADEALWRGLLRATLDRWFSQQDVAAGEQVPVRGTNRKDLANEALAPLRGRLTPEALDRLTMAVMLVFGLEAMITTRDACGLDPERATDLMSWAARALLRTALAEADAP